MIVISICLGKKIFKSLNSPFNVLMEQIKFFYRWDSAEYALEHIVN